MFFDSSLDSLGVSTDDFLDLFATLEQQKGGHGTDAVLGRDVVELVDVDLVEVDASILLGHRLNFGRDNLAGPAPGGKEIDHNQPGLPDNLCELLLRRNLAHGHFNG